MRYIAAIDLLNILLVYTSLAQSRQSAIWAKDASKYIGRYEDIDGPVYKREIRTVKSSPDSILVVTYLGEPDDAEPYFIEVIN